MAFWNSLGNNINATTGFNVFGFLNDLGGWKPKPASPTNTPTPPSNTPTNPTVLTSSSAQNAVTNMNQGIGNITQQQQQMQQANAAAKPKKSDEYQKNIEDSLDDINQGYEDFKTTIDQIKNGTVPYSAEEQSQLDAIKASFDSARARQTIANKRAERAGAATGAGIGARFAAGADLAHRAVEEGIRTLKDLDVEGATKLSEARTAIKDKKLKQAYDAYNAFNDVQKTRSATLNNLYQNAATAERFAYQQEQDAKEFELKKQMANASIENIRSQIAQRNTAATLGVSPKVLSTPQFKGAQSAQSLKNTLQKAIDAVKKYGNYEKINKEGKGLLDSLSIQLRSEISTALEQGVVQPGEAASFDKIAGNLNKSIFKRSGVTISSLASLMDTAQKKLDMNKSALFGTYGVDSSVMDALLNASSGDVDLSSVANEDFLSTLPEEDLANEDFFNTL